MESHAVVGLNVSVALSRTDLLLPPTLNALYAGTLQFSKVVIASQRNSVSLSLMVEFWALVSTI